MSRTIKEIVDEMKIALQNNDIKVMVEDGYRYYTDVLTGTLNIPITTPKETARAYEKLVLDPKQNVSKRKDKFGDLPRVSMYIGQPDTGKSWKAQKLAELCNVPHIIKMCRDNLNLETLLEDFILTDGKPVFQESLALKMMTGKDRGLIIFDEFNI